MRNTNDSIPKLERNTTATTTVAQPTATPTENDTNSIPGLTPCKIHTSEDEDDDESIPDLLPQNLDASDEEDSSDEDTDPPKQIKMSILPFEPGMILLEATTPSEHSEKIKRPIIRKLLFQRPITRRHGCQLRSHQRSIYIMALQTIGDTHPHHYV